MYALVFGLALSVASVVVYVVFVNWAAALLALAGNLYYVVLYTMWLKRATPQNIVIGGAAGAIPPLVGWAAVTGSINIPALFLFAIIFYWTPPHFWALALLKRNEYERGHIPMLPVVHGEKETRWQIFLYSLLVVALTLLLTPAKVTGMFYLASAALLGGILLILAWILLRGGTNKQAWRMYKYSSYYLALLFLAMVVDTAIL
jgi:protoheme IX farnesyltransferase